MKIANNSGTLRACRIFIVVLAAAALMGFFSLSYQNHLYWQEQNQLFLLSKDWLVTYFEKPAWLACMAGDFLTQFYFYTFAGPAILTTMLIITSALAYFSIRNMAGRLTAWVAAAVMLLWFTFSMMDAHSRLSSVIAVAGGLSCFLICRPTCNEKRQFVSIFKSAVGLAVAFWMFGFGFIITALCLVAECLLRRRHIFVVAAALIVAVALPTVSHNVYCMTVADCATYQRLSAPKLPERTLERRLDVENSYYFGDYKGVVSKVRSMSNPDKVELFYYYLTLSHYGTLADGLLSLPNPDLGTLNTIGERTPLPVINMMSDLYYAVGDMTYTERAAMMANSFSPQNRNVRYVKRMAEANLVSGDTLAAMKYLRLLSHTLLYKRWAAAHTPGSMTEQVRRSIEAKRLLQNTQDTLRLGDNCRTILIELLDSNPANTTALDYLLCTDLLLKDIDNFKQDYDRYCMTPNRTRLKPIYQQALLIWLAGTNAPEEEWHRYIADISQMRRFKEYNAKRGSVAFSDTYWYYFDNKK